MATERLDWLQFARKMNIQVIHALYTKSVAQCTLTALPCLTVQPLHLPFVHKPRRISSYRQQESAYVGEPHLLWQCVDNSYRVPITSCVGRNISKFLIFLLIYQFLYLVKTSASPSLYDLSPLPPNTSSLLDLNTRHSFLETLSLYEYFYLEDVGDRFSSNDGKFLQGYRTSHPRRSCASQQHSENLISYTEQI